MGANENDIYNSYVHDGFPSHAGYEVLEGDIIRRIEEIKKLPQEEQSFQLSLLANEISGQYGDQYDIQIIQSLIDKNLGMVV